jgi:D-alanyl-D-alanine carboxypeptidase
MARHKKQKYLTAGLLAALLIGLAYLVWPGSSTPLKPAAPTHRSTSAAPVIPFDKNRYPLDMASSLWVVVNKGRSLPSSYVPAELSVPSVPLRLGAASSEMHLRADSAAALQVMFAAAKDQSINLMLASGYRSYSNQTATYAGFVTSYGAQKADTFSARPGHSEHQTGLAADIEPTNRACELDQCFADTPEGKWLAANSYKYGFIIRYAKGSENLTGYEYEPWHVRFVGADLAAQLRQSGQTMEQFFGLSTGLDYSAPQVLLK